MKVAVGISMASVSQDHLRGGENSIDSRLKNNFLTNGKDNIKTKAMETALELAV